MPTPSDEISLWAYAYRYVDNKGIMTRVGHSPVLRTPRAIFKALWNRQYGAAGSKIARSIVAGLKGTLNNIPVPVVGALAAAFVTKLERMAWQSRYKSKLGMASTDEVDKVKFNLKINDIGDMDSNRRKLVDAINEHNTAQLQLPTAYVANSERGRVCDAFVDYALTVAQVERRMTIINTEIFNILAILVQAADWIDKTAVGTATVFAAANKLGTGSDLTTAIASQTAAVTPAVLSVFGKVNENKKQIGAWIKDEQQKQEDLWKPAGANYIRAKGEHDTLKLQWEARKAMHDGKENAKMIVADAAIANWRQKYPILVAGVPAKPTAYTKIAFPDPEPVFLYLDEAAQLAQAAEDTLALHAHCGSWCYNRAASKNLEHTDITVFRKSYVENLAGIVKFIVSPVEPSLIMSGIKENADYQKELADRA